MQGRFIPSLFQIQYPINNVFFLFFYKENDVTLASVHDSFWTHAATVEEMSHYLRHCFVQLTRTPLLEDLRTQVRSFSRIQIQMVMSKQKRGVLYRSSCDTGSVTFPSGKRKLFVSPWRRRCINLPLSLPPANPRTPLPSGLKPSWSARGSLYRS